MTSFLPWNTKGEYPNNVMVVLFYTIITTELELSSLKYYNHKRSIKVVH